jgi:hypothetical protein
MHPMIYWLHVTHEPADITYKLEEQLRHMLGLTQVAQSYGHNWQIPLLL